MNNILKSLRTMFTGIGGALPTANPTQHGMLALKRAASTEDEAYLVLRDSSGNLQFRQLVTTTVADSNYALEVREGGVSTDTGVLVLDFDGSDFNLTESPENTVAVALAYGTSAGTPAEGSHTHTIDAFSYLEIPATFPVGMEQNEAATTSMASNETWAAYMGRAATAYTTVNVRVQVDTAAATITWAEVGIGTASAISLNGAASITTRGYTDVSASFNTTGDKTVAVTVSGISAGDHLWAMFGSQATTPYQLVRSEVDVIESGIQQYKTSTRPSTMASPTTFGIISSPSVPGPFGFWIGS